MMSRQTIRRTRATQKARKHVTIARIYELCARYGIDVPRVSISSHIDTLRREFYNVRRNARAMGWVPSVRVVEC